MHGDHKVGVPQLDVKEEAVIDDSTIAEIELRQLGLFHGDFDLLVF